MFLAAAEAEPGCGTANRSGAGLSDVFLQPATGKMTLPTIRKVRRSILSDEGLGSLSECQVFPFKYHLIRIKPNCF